VKPHGRIVACGVVSSYDIDPAQGLPGVRGVPAWFVSRRLTLRGFIVSDFLAERDAALLELASCVDTGRLQVREDVIEGIENSPQALIGLLAGENIGKRILKVA
jgi:NADPH-dependent curcumin reductase CurA